MTRLIVALLLVAGAAAAPAAQHRHPSVSLPLHVTAGLISAGGVGNPTGTGRIEVTVNRWSTTGERTRLMNAVSKNNEQKLLEELQKQPAVGSVRFNTELAWDLRYARELQQPDGGTRVVLATDRPMSAWEIWNQPRYSMYPFTIITLDIDADNQMTGNVILAAKVTGDKDGRLLTVENFATQPVQMTDVRLER